MKATRDAGSGTTETLPASAAPGADRRPAPAALQQRYERLATQQSRRRRRLERGRVATFLAVPVCFFSPLWLPVTVPIALVLTAASAAGFFILAVRYGRLERRQRRLSVLRSLARESEARGLRRWDDLPLRGGEPPPPSHAYGADLDLFGPRSLFHLLDAAGTPLGRDTLRGWMLELPPLDETLARQDAVRKLGDMLEFRIELAASGRLAGRFGADEVAGFVRWAEAKPWLLSNPWLVGASRLLPASTLLLAALQITGAIGLPLWPLPLLAGFLLAALTWQRASAIVRRAELRADSLVHVADAFRLIADTALAAPRLTELQARVGAGGGAPRQARRLATLVQLGEIHYSPMLHGLLHGLLLWDLHVAYLLERWQSSSRAAVTPWFAALGEMEALCCLAEIADAHPAWSYPTLHRASEPRISARDLAHPLLPPQQAVGNDVVLDPGRILFVTGSNMSGKSTLLRAIGVNFVLARLGAPVCATSLEVTTSGLYTYFHVRDSLLDGVSSFLAGLRRLKELVDRSTRVEAEASGLVFLLDEPLQGTNPPERQTATRRILRCLVRRNTTGALASHDIALTEPADLQRATIPVHFSERVVPGSRDLALRFDYTLRPGVCTSTNALRLLDALGLPDEGPPDA